MYIKTISLFDERVTALFVDWVASAGLDNELVNSFYIQYRYMETSNWYLRWILKKIFPKPILHVVSRRPGALIGKGGKLMEEYKNYFIRLGFKNVLIHEMSNPDTIHERATRIQKLRSR